MTPIMQIGAVSVPDARTLSISVWDRGSFKSVEKALESDLGLNHLPVMVNLFVFLFLRFLKNAKELVKLPENMPSKVKSLLRNIERDALDGIKN